MKSEASLGWSSLLLPTFPKLPSQCYSTELGNLVNLGSNKQIWHYIQINVELELTARAQISHTLFAINKCLW